MFFFSFIYSNNYSWKENRLHFLVLFDHINGNKIKNESKFWPFSNNEKLTRAICHACNNHHLKKNKIKFTFHCLFSHSFNRNVLNKSLQKKISQCMSVDAISLNYPLRYISFQSCWATNIHLHCLFVSSLFFPL